MVIFEFVRKSAASCNDFWTGDNPPASDCVIAGVSTPLAWSLVKSVFVPVIVKVTSVPALLGSTSYEFDNDPGAQVRTSQFTSAPEVLSLCSTVHPQINANRNRLQ